MAVMSSIFLNTSHFLVLKKNYLNGYRQIDPNHEYLWGKRELDWCKESKCKNSKNKIISKVYHDPAGFSSIKETYKDAHNKDKSITYKDVADWFKSNVSRKTQLKGYNSFIAQYPKQEYQIDLFVY